MGIKVVLIIFQIMTGLKVNFHKSNLYSARSDCPDSQCTGIYAWMYTWDFFFFLNIWVQPLEANLQGRNIGWKKITTKFTSWRSSTLSQAGRLVLIRSVLDSIPTYWLSLKKLPVGVQKDLKKLKRQFFWRRRTKQMLRSGNSTLSDGKSFVDLK